MQFYSQALGHKIGETEMTHNPLEDIQMRLAVFVVKVLVIGQIAGFVNGLVKLVLLDFVGAAIWVIGSSFAFALTVASLLILAQR